MDSWLNVADLYREHPKLEDTRVKPRDLPMMMRLLDPAASTKQNTQQNSDLLSQFGLDSEALGG